MLEELQVGCQSDWNGVGESIGSRRLGRRSGVRSLKASEALGDRNGLVGSPALRRERAGH